MLRGRTWYDNVSLFGIFAEYGFSGVHASSTTQFLIIKDPITTPRIEIIHW